MPGILQPTKKILINLPRTWVAKLRELAHKESLRTGEEIQYTDLIRKAIEEKHPEVEKKA